MQLYNHAILKDLLLQFSNYIIVSLINYFFFFHKLPHHHTFPGVRFYGIQTFGQSADIKLVCREGFVTHQLVASIKYRNCGVG